MRFLLPWRSAAMPHSGFSPSDPAEHEAEMAEYAAMQQQWQEQLASTLGEACPQLFPTAQREYLGYLLARIGIEEVPESIAALLTQHPAPAVALAYAQSLGLDYARLSAVAPVQASAAIQASAFYQQWDELSRVRGTSRHDSAQQVYADASPLLPVLASRCHATLARYDARHQAASAGLRIGQRLGSALQRHLSWPTQGELLRTRWHCLLHQDVLAWHELLVSLHRWQSLVDTALEPLLLRQPALNRERAVLLWTAGQREPHLWPRHWPKPGFLHKLRAVLPAGSLSDEALSLTLSLPQRVGPLVAGVLV